MIKQQATHYTPLFSSHSNADSGNSTTDVSTYNRYKTIFIIGSVAILIVLGIGLLIGVGLYCFKKSSEAEDGHGSNSAYDGSTEEDEEERKNRHILRHKIDLERKRRELQKDQGTTTNQSNEGVTVEYDVDEILLNDVKPLTGDVIIDPTIMPTTENRVEVRVPKQGSAGTSLTSVVVMSGMNPEQEWEEMETEPPEIDPTASSCRYQTVKLERGDVVQLDPEIDNFDFLQNQMKTLKKGRQPQRVVEDEGEDLELFVEKKNPKKKKGKKGKGRK